MKTGKLLPALGLAAAITANSSAQSIELAASLSQKTGASYVRPDVGMRLGRFGAGNFTEFYKEGGFFGKAKGTFRMAGNLRMRNEYVYGTDMTDRFGMGLDYKFPTSEGTLLGIKAMPLWFDTNGDRLERFVLGMEGELNFPHGFYVYTFEEANLRKKDGRRQWGYGELFVGKKIDKAGKFRVGYSALLKNQNKLTPRVEHALSVVYRN